jgi:hypothetical protein
MKCDEVRTRLSDYVGGDLFPSEQEAVASHLAQCATCRTEAAVLQRCERALGVLGVVAEPPDLSEDLRRRIAAPLPWRRRWGAAAAVAGVALVVAVVMALAWPRDRARDVAPPLPVFVEAPAPVEAEPAVPEGVEVTPPPLVVTAAEPPATEVVEVPQPTVRAPSPVPAEVVPQQASVPTVVSVRVQAPPAGLEAEAVMEAVPVTDSPTTQPGQTGGVVLLLGQAEPVRPPSSCYLEVSLPNGARSILERSAEAGAAGAPRVIQISYEQIAPQPKAQD